MANKSFPSSERLKSKKLIGKIFREGRPLYKYPIRALCTTEELDNGGGEIKVAFAVPKKKIPKAVSRNKLRRRMKEAYRVNRKEILNEKEFGGRLNIVFVYLKDEMLEYRIIEKSMIKLLKEIKKTLE